MVKVRRRGLLLVLAMVALPAGAAVDLGQFVRKDEFNEIKISPSGEYYAATVPLEDSTALTLFRRADLKVTGVFRPRRNAHVNGFEWISDDRVLISIAEKFGMLDQPQPTGEIYTLDALGGRPDLLVGFRVQGNGAGTRIQPKKVEDVAAFLIDGLPGDDRNAVIAVWPLVGDEPFTRAERLDVQSGRRTTLARAPVRRASFVTDNGGEVRLAYGADVDNAASCITARPPARSGAWSTTRTRASGSRFPSGFRRTTGSPTCRCGAPTPAPTVLSPGIRPATRAPPCCITRLPTRCRSSIAMARRSRSARR